MSSSVAGPDAVACLERILEAQVRLVELQEAQVRLLERCAPVPPPPPGEQAAQAAAGPPAPPSALPCGLPAAEPPPAARPREASPPPVMGEAARAPADGERPLAPPAGPAAEDTCGGREEESDVQKATGPREAPPPQSRVLGEAAAHGMRAPADGERPPPAGPAAAAGRAPRRRGARPPQEEGSKATPGEESKAATDLQRELGEEILICGAWEPEISHNNLVWRNSRRPDRIPIALERLLVVLGVLSPLEISAGWRRCVYRLHQAYIPFSLILSFVIDAVRMYVVYVVIGMDTDVSEVTMHVLRTIGRLLLVLPSFFVWRHQFSTRGAILALMCSMDERQFTWQHVTNGVRIALCLSVGVMALAYCLMWSSEIEPVLDAGLALGSASSVRLCLGLAVLIAEFCHAFVFLCSHFLVFFASRLHQHDLLCYAGAMVKAMEGDGVASDVVPSLKKLEFQMTARLRYASRTWVRLTMCEILFLGACSVVSAMFLLSGNYTNAWLGALVLTSTIVVVLLVPMAAVTETFQEDVVKALNNPSILNGAQKCFGQQFLAHLNSLEWGFRFGGVVVSYGFVSQVAATLGIGVLTFVSAAIQSAFADAIF